MMTSGLSEPVVQSIEKIMALAEAQGRHMLYEHEVYDILADMGLSVP